MFDAPYARQWVADDGYNIYLWSEMQVMGIDIIIGGTAHTLHLAVIDRIHRVSLVGAACLYFDEAYGVGFTCDYVYLYAVYLGVALHEGIAL